MLSRWDPFRELWDMRRTMNRLMEGSMYGPEGFQQAFAMPIDVRETADSYEIEASMPGIDPENIEITMEGSALTIRGEMQSEQEKSGEKYHMRERRSGTYYRSLTLPSSLDANAVQASYENGILKIRVPKVEEAKPKRIQIQSGSTSKSIEG